MTLKIKVKTAPKISEFYFILSQFLTGLTLFLLHLCVTSLNLGLHSLKIVTLLFMVALKMMHVYCCCSLSTATIE